MKLINLETSGTVGRGHSAPFPPSRENFDVEVGILDKNRHPIHQAQ